jgi:hypothetical protein
MNSKSSTPCPGQRRISIPLISIISTTLELNTYIVLVERENHVCTGHVSLFYLYIYTTRQHYLEPSIKSTFPIQQYFLNDVTMTLYVSNIDTFLPMHTRLLMVKVKSLFFIIATRAANTSSVSASFKPISQRVERSRVLAEHGLMMPLRRV